MKLFLVIFGTYYAIALLSGVCLGFGRYTNSPFWDNRACLPGEMRKTDALLWPVFLAFLVLIVLYKLLTWPTGLAVKLGLKLSKDEGGAGT